MKIWFTTTAKQDQHRENEVFLTGMRSSLRDSGYQIAETPEDADLILYFEPNHYKGREYARTLLSEECIQRYPSKCFAVNYDDVPIGFLPGIYVGMPQRRMDPHHFKAGCYIQQYNALCPIVAERRDQVQPQLLFSFRGSASAKVRTRLFAAGFSGSEVAVQQTFAWFNHTEEEKQGYLEEMLNSKFVLCPRGRATVSIRLFETMELGRVPVILSDEWVAPEGPSWSECSIRVAERSVGELPTLLKSYESRAEEMGRQARYAWEQWFSPQMRVARTVGYAEELMRGRGENYVEENYRKKWLGVGFARETAAIRLKEVIQQGRILDKITSKLLKQ